MTNSDAAFPLILPLLSDGEDKNSPLKNRLRKNYRHLRKWGKRTGTDCFRIYDKDIKAFPLAIDFYAGRFLIQYYSEDRENDEPRPDLKAEAESALCTLFEISEDSIYWRVRVKRKKLEQYEKISEVRDSFIVYEYGAKFKVNLVDYLDTGLFLDHRETRQRVAAISKGKSLLNLFAYTCAFSVQAALGGAKYTKSVDLSNTYTEWGKENFLLNKLSLSQNDVMRADCLKFLEDEVYKGKKYDIIVIDPPTISRSKKMDQTFDIQLDHVKMLGTALELLAPGGIIFFSTNSRRFKFDVDQFDDCLIKEITGKTIPQEFGKKIHRCWTIE